MTNNRFLDESESNLIYVYNNFLHLMGCPKSLIISSNGVFIRREPYLVGMYFLVSIPVVWPQFLISQCADFMKSLQNEQPDVETMLDLVIMCS